MGRQHDTIGMAWDDTINRGLMGRAEPPIWFAWVNPIQHNF